MTKTRERESVYYFDMAIDAAIEYVKKKEENDWKVM
jgi:hypothetical protein